ncbi:MAG: YerC/YecD family TrpR-related protein [Oscillospiraceae bacterium]|nr:YerC/YecD family TrpR-related protein [Oscillospiraceae bacterium]
MNKKLQDKNIDFLFNAVLELKSLEECYDFFEDVCTILELKSIAQRLKVAKLLTEKRVYNYIVEKTGASTATISRVNRTLNYGNDGYKVIFERLAEKGVGLPDSDE